MKSAFRRVLSKSPPGRKSYALNKLNLKILYKNRKRLIFFSFDKLKYKNKDELEIDRKVFRNYLVFYNRE